jgi:hypothetical protein
MELQMSRAERVVMRIEYMPVIPSKTKPRGVRGFLNYVQHRDQHQEEHEPDVRGFMDYAAHRDAASSRGRLFDATGIVGRQERVALGDYIERSIARDKARGGPRSSTNNHGWYSIIISPEKASGLDLRRLTRAAVGQLRGDVGGRGIPPWIAAEHRNTKHPHVHLIMAGRVEVSPDQFRTVLITGARRERLQAAIDDELSRQRRERHKQREALVERLGEVASPARRVTHERDRQSAITTWRGTAPRQSSHRRQLLGHGGAGFAQIAGRLARHYQREAEEEARRRGYSSTWEQRKRELGRERGA